MECLCVCLTVCLSVTNSQVRPEGPLWCQPKAGTLACAGRRPAYMLVIIIINNLNLFLIALLIWFYHNLLSLHVFMAVLIFIFDSFTLSSLPFFMSVSYYS